jgi:hypothetical protein
LETIWGLLFRKAVTTVTTVITGITGMKILVKREKRINSHREAERQRNFYGAHKLDTTLRGRI